MRQQRGFGPNAKAHHFFGRHHGDFGKLFSGRVVIDMGVDQKYLSVGQQEGVHTGIGVDTRTLADDLVDVLQMQARGAPGAANQPVNLPLVQQHGSNQGQTPTHFDFGCLLGHALALGHAVVSLPEVAVAVIRLHVDHSVVNACAQSQAKFLHPGRDHGGPSDQGGQSQALVHHDLRGT